MKECKKQLHLEKAKNVKLQKKIQKLEDESRKVSPSRNVGTPGARVLDDLQTLTSRFGFFLLLSIDR